MGQLPAILAPASSFPLQLAQTQVACAHAVEQSIPSAQVISLQSAQLFLPALKIAWWKQWIAYAESI